MGEADEFIASRSDVTGQVRLRGVSRYRPDGQWYKMVSLRLVLDLL